MTKTLNRMAAATIIVAALLAITGCVAHASTGRHTSTSGRGTMRWGAFATAGVHDSHEATTPAVVATTANVTTIAAGNASSMALDSSGTVWVWGLGVHGDLGQGNLTAHVKTAVVVPGLPPITAIAESQDTDYAITASGDVYGWGWNAGGQLCLGDTEQHDSPVQLPLWHITAAAGGSDHMIFLTATGTVISCGGNPYGQLGDGTTVDATTPQSVVGLPDSPVVQVSGGEVDSTALLEDGQVWDWGRNNFGQLGNDTLTDSDVAVQVQLPTTASSIYTGGSIDNNGQALGILTNGTVFAWGNDAYGQFCDDTTATNNPTPVKAFTAVQSGTSITKVATGGYASYGIDAAGNVWACGRDTLGQVGNGHSRGNVLMPVVVLRGATMVSSTASNVAAYQP